jgi:hypothetical protein
MCEQHENKYSLAILGDSSPSYIHARLCFPDFDTQLKNQPSSEPVAPMLKVTGQVLDV